MENNKDKNNFDKEENKVDKKLSLNKTGKTQTGKPKNPIDINPQLKDDDGLRREAIDLAATPLGEKALTIVQRQKRSRIFKRNLPKIQRARLIAQKRQASPQKLQVRAERAARELLKKRFAGRKGTAYADLSVSEKIQVDKRLEGKAKLIKKIAMRLLPRIRRAEVQRLQSFYKGTPMTSKHQEPTLNESFEKMFGVFSNHDQATIKEMVQQHQPEDLIDIIENMIDDLAKDGNPIVDTLREMLDNVAPKNPIYESLMNKAVKNGVPFEVLEEVFNRGLDAWDGKRGTQEQYAFDRVNSYISHGKAYDLDADLHEGRADVKRIKVKLPDGRVVWKTYRKSTEVEKRDERDARDEMEESNNTPYVKPHDNGRAWKASNKHGKVRYFGKDFKAAAEKHAGITSESNCGPEAEGRLIGKPSLTKRYKKQTPGEKVNEAFADLTNKRQKEEKKRLAIKHAQQDAAAKVKDIRTEQKHTETASDERKEIELVKRGKEKPDEKNELEMLRRAHIQVKKKVIDEDVNEDLRKWFGKGKEGDWVRVGTDGEIKGDCAREEGEGKPKCMPRSKAHSMDKDDRATAARRKRREDPVADRQGKGGKPINVRTEEAEQIDETDDGIKKLGKKIGHVNGYHIHDLGANTKHKAKRFLAYTADGLLSHTSGSMTDMEHKTNSMKKSVPAPKRTEHDDWRDDMKHRIASGEIRRAVMSRRGMREETEVSTSLNEAFVMDRVAGIGTTITAEEAGINMAGAFHHYPGVEELNQLLAAESLIKEGFGKMLEEVDEEGKMARGQLSSLIKNAQSLIAKMKDDKQLDAWIQSKITKAADYIKTVADYLENNKQDVDENK